MGRYTYDEDRLHEEFVDRLQAALDVGDGYVLITLDPDGLKIVPATRLEDRVEMRQLSKRIREMRESGIVASHEGGRDGQLPSLTTPPTSSP